MDADAVEAARAGAHAVDASPPFEYAGPEALAARVEAALTRVVDPEMALDIVNLGLVRRVTVDGDAIEVVMTMTSAACPVTELIVEDVRREVVAGIGEAARVDVELQWDPPWTPERMTARARATMGWA